MAKFTALLIGVSEYDDRRINSLPFVPGDLVELSNELTAADYKVHVSPATTRTRIRSQVQAQINAADDGDALLIYLSGHGVRTGGVDYLLPSDADTGFSPFTDTCVPIDWDADI